jgi:hypothetical protein
MIYSIGAHTSVQVDIDRTPLRIVIWYADKVRGDLDEIKRMKDKEAARAKRGG